MPLPLLLALSISAIFLVGWLAWFAGRRAAAREGDGELRSARMQHAAELRKVRRDLVLEREKARKSEDFSQVVVKAREDGTTRIRRESAERDQQREAEIRELREVLLLAKQEIDRLRGRLAELEWATTPNRKGSAKLVATVAESTVPDNERADSQRPEPSELEIEIDLSHAEEPSLPGEESRPSPMPETPPASPFDETAGTVFASRAVKVGAIAAVPTSVESLASAEPPPGSPAPEAVAGPVPAVPAAAVPPAPMPLEALQGIGPAVAKNLRAVGIDSLEALAAASPTAVRGAVPKRNRDRAEKWIDGAKALLAAEPEPSAGPVEGAGREAAEPEKSRGIGRKRRRR